ncbi:RecF recombinational DNA repair ATPase [Legionella gratiana]|uniref:DNA replication and repair protein RecF n=1 Tax=Legionella gratiana TaxID=45066 RepID=A0A378IYX3_9GAMM|nr:DNA replication/repair protein RecF [Legionella gratiana]KTD11822.1 RecF recombinational DNA repair ATPase [Legionella gratiana]STX40674.1 RecF recombinational DNA repair ATPase [Legionella gratiana]
MILTELKIHHLRNILSAHLELNSRFNFILGPNGSGKTSVLEAFYLLSCGHSFRTREISPIISHGQPSLTVFARGINEETISIQKSYSGATQVKLNNQFCSTTSQLAYALPCQIFYSDLFQIIDAGPSVRRNLLDWGLFHVKHDYFSIWKEYKRVLKQRNALLKVHAPYTQFIPWDKQLNQLANQLHLLREEYFIQWEREFTLVLLELSELDCKLRYVKGWDKKNTGKNLEQILFENFESDRQKLYTQHGAHQADFIVEISHNKAKYFLSRGQQKIILISLKLAQANLVAENCLYLIDDLAAELDEAHQIKVMSYLLKRNGQYVITSNSNSNSLLELISSDNSAIYQINNGIL